jgi:hypothetical protein
MIEREGAKINNESIETVCVRSELSGTRKINPFVGAVEMPQATEVIH